MTKLQKIDNLLKFYDNRNDNSTFSTGTLSLQASQQIKSGDDISFSINSIKCFLRKVGKNTI